MSYVHLPRGRPIPATLTDPRHRKRAPMLELQGVTKRYRRGSEEVVAANAVDLCVRAGERVAVVGPSGSGKSTILHLAAGLDHPDAGHVLFDEVRLDRMSIAQRAQLRRRKIGFVFQFFHLIPSLSVAENVELPLLLDRVRVRANRVAELLEQVGIGDRAAHLPSELSGGEMQRVAIARALVAEPRLVLADEPTGSLDSDTGAVILDVLVEAVDSRSSALIMATHDQAATHRMDRVLQVRDGVLTE